MKKRWFIIISLIILSFHLYSQIYFSEQIVIDQTDVDSPQSVYTADLDGDGDMDILAASADDDKIAWYENTDGKGAFGPQQVINTDTDSPRSVYASDLDGDGDMDVVSASIFDDKVAWYENTDGQGTFGPLKLISSAANGAVSVYTADLDGDNDMDILTALYTDNSVVWYENTDGKGDFGLPQVITTEAALVAATYGSDLDGDGDIDVLSASTMDDKIAWYENTDGKGNYGPQQVINSNADMANSVYSSDLDGDGDLDVLSASFNDSKIAWYENMDGQGTFGPEQPISTNAIAARSVYASDLDGDGDIDVLSALNSDKNIAYYENTDGRGTFGPQAVISAKDHGTVFVYSSDLDGNGSMDVLSASNLDNKIAWYRNREQTKWDEMFIEHLIDADFSDVNSVHSGDMDGDGDQDVLGASNNLDEIAWWENLDLGSGSFYKHIIDEEFMDAYTVFAADLDGDEDIDILGGTYFENEISWWENFATDTFAKHIIDDDYAWPQSVYAIDMDKDGDMDVLGASKLDGSIALFENDGSGNFTKNVFGSFSSINSIHASDVDGDGDVDVIGARSSEVAWWENDGKEIFNRHVIGENLSLGICVIAFDIDNDEDVDILAADKYGNEIIWWENDGFQSFTKESLDLDIGWPNRIYASDLDNDNDMDVLAVSYADGYLCLYENLGSKSFIKHFIHINFYGASSVYSADFDNDGDKDILGASSSSGDILWWENTLISKSNLLIPEIIIEPDTLFFSAGSNGNLAELTIKNNGSATLYIQDISSDADWIIKVDTSNFLLLPEKDRVVTIHVSDELKFNGIYESTLEITSNDPVNTIQDIPVILEVIDGLDVNFIPEIEPNDKETEAQKLSGPSPAGVKGRISVTDMGEISIQGDDIEDLYEFTLLSNQLKIYLYDISADLDIILMQIEGNTTTIRGSNHRGAAVDEEYEVSDLEPGTYHVGVSIYDPYPIENNSTYSLVLVGDIYMEVDNTAPVITINSPVEGHTYETNMVPLEWDIEETFFKDAWFSLDNGPTTTSLDKSGNTTIELENGEYNLTLYAVDNSENESNVSVSFSVNKQATGFTLKEAQDDVINIYPNPAYDLVTIQYNSTGNYSVVINSINGQVFYDKTSGNPVHQIDLSSFQKGVYFITVRSKDFVTTEKIIKI